MPHSVTSLVVLSAALATPKSPEKAASLSPTGQCHTNLNVWTVTPMIPPGQPASSPHHSTVDSVKCGEWNRARKRDKGSLILTESAFESSSLRVKTTSLMWIEGQGEWFQMYFHFWNSCFMLACECVGEERWAFFFLSILKALPLTVRWWNFKDHAWHALQFSIFLPLCFG